MLQREIDGACSTFQFLAVLGWEDQIPTDVVSTKVIDDVVGLEYL